MSKKPDLANLEERLIAEMADIERKIGELLKEKMSLQRILQRVRAESLVKVDVTRKNSYNKILVEHTIIETLKSSSKPLTTSKLSSGAKDVVYGLKDSTIRSYLFRMKERGLIVNKGVGLWTLPLPRGRADPL
jgi:hypothetical protein